jgi:hypothetical protein
LEQIIRHLLKMVHFLDTYHKEKCRNFTEAIKSDGLEVHRSKIYLYLQLVWDTIVMQKFLTNPFQHMTDFKYLEPSITNQNYIRDEVKKSLNLGNACYHSAEIFLSLYFYSRTLNIKINKTSLSSVL